MYESCGSALVRQGRCRCWLVGHQSGQAGRVSRGRGRPKARAAHGASSHGSLPRRVRSPVPRSHGPDIRVGDGSLGTVGPHDPDTVPVVLPVLRQQDRGAMQEACRLSRRVKKMKEYGSRDRRRRCCRSATRRSRRVIRDEPPGAEETALGLRGRTSPRVVRGGGSRATAGRLLGLCDHPCVLRVHRASCRPADESSRSSTVTTPAGGVCDRRSAPQ